MDRRGGGTLVYIYSGDIMGKYTLVCVYNGNIMGKYMLVYIYSGNIVGVIYTNIPIQWKYNKGYIH